MYICEFAACVIMMQTKCNGSTQNGQAAGGQEETGSFGERQNVTQVWKEQRIVQVEMKEKDILMEWTI